MFAQERVPRRVALGWVIVGGLGFCDAGDAVRSTPVAYSLIARFAAACA